MVYLTRFVQRASFIYSLGKANAEVPKMEVITERLLHEKRKLKICSTPREAMAVKCQGYTEGQDVIIVRKLATLNETVMNSHKFIQESRGHTRQLHMMTVKALD